MIPLRDRSWLVCAFALALWAFGICIGKSATFTVTTIDDAGPGSLRQAILDANQNTNSADRIEFNITGAGPHTIALASRLPFITDAVTIDGYTQPGTAQNTLSNGFNAVIKIRLDGRFEIENIAITAGEATIRGLALLQFNGPGIDIGGSARGCAIQGNLIGVDIDGVPRGNVGVGINIGTGPHLIGGPNPADRNVIGANYSHGIYLASTASNVVAQGNFVGTDQSGRFARANQGCGFFCWGTHDHLIGGTQAGAGNLISGNLINGIEINAGTSSITVQGNLIGTDITGTAPLANANGHGVLIGGGSIPFCASNTIGGATAGARNVIAFNRLDGVHIDEGTNHLVRGNSIFSNGQLGIDLGPVEIGPDNDFGDFDKGPNNLQNYPFLGLGTNQFTALSVPGSINSRASRSYFIDLYANRQCDPTGRGEGEVYLGSLTVFTDSTGTANFSATVPMNDPQFQLHSVTATATDEFGNTSEFSPCSGIVVARPKLEIAAADDGRVRLQWSRVVPTNFVVETTTNLSSPIWPPAPGQVNTNGEFQTFDFPINPAEPARFFRLHSSQ